MSHLNHRRGEQRGPSRDGYCSCWMCTTGKSGAVSLASGGEVSMVEKTRFSRELAAALSVKEGLPEVGPDLDEDFLAGLGL